MVIITEKSYRYETIEINYLSLQLHCSTVLIDYNSNLACIFSGKAPGNLPSKVFQHFFARMSDAISESPERMASELFSKKLISRDTLGKIQVASTAPYEKASSLLLAVQATISSSESDKDLRKLCKTLSKFPNFKQLSTQIMEKYGKLMVLLGYVLKFL